MTVHLCDWATICPGQSCPRDALAGIAFVTEGDLEDAFDEWMITIRDALPPTVYLHGSQLYTIAALVTSAERDDMIAATRMAIEGINHRAIVESHGASPDTEETVDVDVVLLTQRHQLLRWYDGRDAPQPCHIELALESGDLRADYNPEVRGGYPMSVHHRRVLWYPISLMTNDAANDLLLAAAPIAQRVLDGASVAWDGHNRVGHLTAAAQVASDSLAVLCASRSDDPDGRIAATSAEGWFGGETAADTVERLHLTANTTDEELSAIAAMEVDEALDEGCAVQGIEQYLRDNLRGLRS